METNYRISPFVELGRRLARQLAGGELDAVVARAIAENGWFTRQSVAQAIEAICTDLLDETVLRDWLARYPRPDASAVRRVGIVLAGNIPLVGFFDLLCVLASGHACRVKPSSKDTVLIGYVVDLLRTIDPAIPLRIAEQGERPDAVIATGSDNANRYFRMLFGGIPSLLRGSRQSVAVLSGRETAAELDIPLREGVYFYCYGPQYETPAEIRAARILGGDAVGMSTAPEVIMAGHCGMEVLGLTLLSNMAAGILDQPLSEQEVLDAAAAAREKFSGLIRACLKKM